MNLVLSPHPDDAEYSVSGTIFKSNDFWKIVTLSSGGDNDETTSHSRLEECESFWADKGNVCHIGRNSKTIDEYREYELVAIIDDLLDNVDTIYVPPLEDNHFEHRRVSKAARAATRGKSITLIEYYTPSTRSTWVPNLFVDIDDYMYEKDFALHQHFKSQDDRFYFSEKNIEIFHEDYFCRLRGLDKVEKFRVEYQFK
jgi:LmbE family N-acetylglucosaminyl deacetylase